MKKNEVELAVGSLQDYSGKNAVNTTGKPIIEPIRRVTLPQGNHVGTPTGYGLSIITKKDKLMLFVQFSVDNVGDVLLPATESEFTTFTNTRGIRYSIECGAPKNGYTDLLKIEKA